MSNYLWIRKWKILVVDAQDKEALNVSNMRVKFSVKKSREISNFATVEIYNLTAETEQKIIKEGDRVIIEAGYEGYLTAGADGTVKQADGAPAQQYGKIFDGKVIYPSRRKENNTDYILSLLCVDGDNVFQQNFVSMTFNKGLNQRQVLESVCNKSQTKIPTNSITDNLSKQQLPRGKVVFGEPKDYIADIARGNSASYWMEDGELVVSKLTDNAQGEAIVVSPKTGLIGMPEQTQYGANFKLLLNPAVHMRSLVKIANSEIIEAAAKPGVQQAGLDPDWIYQVIELVHRGDTRGEDWCTECTGVSRYGVGMLPALMANSAQNPLGT